uniref:Protein DDI1 homolog 2 n=2 Tax=Cacopsylla melanoneura TaxID=428564 RepID=A0A8D8RVG4_9HEMI
MKVTVTSLENEVFLLDVSEDLELENFKAFCEVQSGISAQEIDIEFQGNPLADNKKTLKDYNIQDGDLVLLKRVRVHRPNNQPAVGMPNLDFSRIVVPGSSSVPSNSLPTNVNSRREDPAQLKQLLLADPHKVSLLKQNNPQLADALLTGSLDDFARILRQQYEEREKREQLRQRMLTADPFDTEAQKLIAEEIKKSNIQANMEAAMEYNPETFGSVIMLYINCNVNGHPVKAFIDSGAQTTIMSAACAARVNITRLIDTRWAGIAKGVGVQRIIGRIHMVQIAIENDFLTTSFSVLEEQPMDMLLGLDMLKRHQCCIDLQRNVLQIGTTGTVTPFLAEADLPEVARLTYNGSAQDEELYRKMLEESKNKPGGSSS